MFENHPISHIVGELHKSEGKGFISTETGKLPPFIIETLFQKFNGLPSVEIDPSEISFVLNPKTKEGNVETLIQAYEDFSSSFTTDQKGLLLNALVNFGQQSNSSSFFLLKEGDDKHIEIANQRLTDFSKSNPFKISNRIRQAIQSGINTTYLSNIISAFLDEIEQRTPGEKSDIFIEIDKRATSESSLIQFLDACCLPSAIAALMNGGIQQSDREYYAKQFSQSSGSVISSDDVFPSVAADLSMVAAKCLLSSHDNWQEMKDSLVEIAFYTKVVKSFGDDDQKKALSILTDTWFDHWGEFLKKLSPSTFINNLELCSHKSYDIAKGHITGAHTLNILSNLPTLYEVVGAPLDREITRLLKFKLAKAECSDLVSMVNKLPAGFAVENSMALLISARMRDTMNPGNFSTTSGKSVFTQALNAIDYLLKDDPENKTKIIDEIISKWSHLALESPASFMKQLDKFSYPVEPSHMSSPTGSFIDRIFISDVSGMMKMILKAAATQPNIEIGSYFDDHLVLLLHELSKRTGVDYANQYKKAYFEDGTSMNPGFILVEKFGGGNHELMFKAMDMDITSDVGMDVLFSMIDKRGQEVTTGQVFREDLHYGI